MRGARWRHKKRWIPSMGEVRRVESLEHHVIRVMAKLVRILGMVGENRRVRVPDRSSRSRCARPASAIRHTHAIPLRGGRFPEGNHLSKRQLLIRT